VEGEKQLIDIRETLGEKGHDGKRQMRMMIGLGTCVADHCFLLHF